MKLMLTVCRTILILADLALILYAALGVYFVGGEVELINLMKSGGVNPIGAHKIIWFFVKTGPLALLIGWIGFVLTLGGWMLFKKSIH